MIRREVGSDWLLIPQIEHAHVAGDLAAAWVSYSPLLLGEGPGVRVPPARAGERSSVGASSDADHLLAAVRHHDDGWREWDAAPRIDPATGIPRSFTEMPMPIATVIWSRSIDLCGQDQDWQGEATRESPTTPAQPASPHFPSPLAGIAVSKHFCWLAEQALESRSGEPQELAAIERFLEMQTRQQVAWRDALLHQPDRSKPELDAAIENGFHAVQFFDRLSLWLCCAPQTESSSAECPGCGSFRFTPLTPYRVAIEPYPLSPAAGKSFEVSVAATRIAARRYADDDDLLGALHESNSERSTWTLSSK